MSEWILRLLRPETDEAKESDEVETEPRPTLMKGLSALGAITTANLGIILGAYAIKAALWDERLSLAAAGAAFVLCCGAGALGAYWIVRRATRQSDEASRS